MLCCIPALLFQRPTCGCVVLCTMPAGALLLVWFQICTCGNSISSVCECLAGAAVLLLPAPPCCCLSCCCCQGDLIVKTKQSSEYRTLLHSSRSPAAKLQLRCCSAAVGVVTMLWGPQIAGDRSNHYTEAIRRASASGPVAPFYCCVVQGRTGRSTEEGLWRLVVVLIDTRCWRRIYGANWPCYSRDLNAENPGSQLAGENEGTARYKQHPCVSKLKRLP